MFFFVLCSRFFDVAFMFGSPFCDLGKKRSEAKSQRCGFVFYTWRNFGILGTFDKAVTFEFAELLGEHFLRDAADSPQKLIETHGFSS